MSYPNAECHKRGLPHWKGEHICISTSCSYTHSEPVSLFTSSRIWPPWRQKAEKKKHYIFGNYGPWNTLSKTSLHIAERMNAKQTLYICNIFRQMVLHQHHRRTYYCFCFFLWLFVYLLSIRLSCSICPCFYFITLISRSFFPSLFI